MDIQVGELATEMTAFILSLSVHEWAHAASANRLGDSTAADQGRMTLNPLVHIDPFGTIAMPIIGAITGGFLFAWAKPVPVNPSRFKNRRLGDIMVSAAGPLSNLMLATIFTLVMSIYAAKFGDALKPGQFFYPLLDLGSRMITLNMLLFAFNFVPLPPLDGGSVFRNLFLPTSLANAYDEFAARFGTFALIVIAASGGLQFVGKISRILSTVWIHAGLSLFQS